MGERKTGARENEEREAKSIHQVFALERAAHLQQRLLLQLANPLARQVVLLADLFERELLVGVEAEALPQDVGLDRLQRMELRAHLGGHASIDQQIRGRVVLGVRILDEVDELPPVLVGDRAIERERLIREEGAHLLDLGRGDPGRRRQLFRGRLAPELDRQLRFDLATRW